MAPSFDALVSRTRLIKKSCWLTYTCTHDAPPLKSRRVWAQCWCGRFVRAVNAKSLGLDVHASFWGHLFDSTCQIDTTCLFQISRSICLCFLLSDLDLASVTCSIQKIDVPFPNSEDPPPSPPSLIVAVEPPLAVCLLCLPS